VGGRRHSAHTSTTLGREVGDREPESYLYVAEGVHSSLAVTKWPDGHKSLHVGGKTVATTQPQDMRLQRMLGHFPALFHPAPGKVLIVGMGTGVTAGSFVAYPEVERIVICEIEPLVADAAERYFARENLDVLRDQRVELVFDDGRHFLASTREKFDIITSDPIHPWMDGAAALYSTEYYELVRDHLLPGGLVAQWVPAYETDLPTVRSALATFFEVFPQGTVWSSHIPMQKGNDFVMIGQTDSLKIDAFAISDRIESNPKLRESLEEIDLGYIVTFLAAYAGRGPDLAEWLRGAEINRDRSLRLQYLAGLAIDRDLEVEIYRAIARQRRFPRGLITAPRRVLDRLEALWGG
jgi:spermidine synthase